MGISMQHYHQGRQPRGRQVGGSGGGMLFLLFVVLPAGLIYFYLGRSRFWMSTAVIIGSAILSVGMYFLTIGIVWLRLVLAARKTGWTGSDLPYNKRSAFATATDRTLIGAAIGCLLLIGAGLIAAANEWMSLTVTLEVLWTWTVVILGSATLSAGSFFLTTGSAWFLLMISSRSRSSSEIRQGGAELPARRMESPKKYPLWYSGLPHIGRHRDAYNTVVVRTTLGSAIGCVLLIATGLVSAVNEWVSLPPIDVIYTPEFVFSIMMSAFVLFFGFIAWEQFTESKWFWRRRRAPRDHEHGLDSLPGGPAGEDRV